jgi:transcriptional regulator with XRE-family HTH domain
MPKTDRRKPQTKIAARRQQIRLSQKQLSDLSGISLRTIQRLERGDVENPPIRYLVNLAMALDCQLTDICEDAWFEWTVLKDGPPKPPPAGHWLPERRN